ncbi:hypothetical protein G6011_06089 [Alternaria panax]|uniref:Uncharacterized protein n=1 Tax=Alternaria panax TaxID=48097 RepID=A0AAD4I988_9PLEO|nr:hypothetical protein G6011_06089 [Alternaria panax]
MTEGFGSNGDRAISAYLDSVGSLAELLRRFNATKDALHWTPTSRIATDQAITVTTSPSAASFHVHGIKVVYGKTSRNGARVPSPGF